MEEGLVRVRQRCSLHTNQCVGLDVDAGPFEPPATGVGGCYDVWHSMSHPANNRHKLEAHAIEEGDWETQEVLQPVQVRANSAWLPETNARQATGLCC